MRTKRFVGDTMQQAIRQVREEFGSEAVIIQTRAFRKGGFFGLFGRKKIEVIAAIDSNTAPRATGVSAANSASRSTGASAPGVSAPGSPPESRLAQRKASEAPRQGDRKPGLESLRLKSLREEETRMARLELGRLKQLVDTVSGDSGLPFDLDSDEASDQLYWELREHDVETEYARALVDAGRRALRTPSGDLRQAVKDCLAVHVPCAVPWEPDGRKRRVALVGPTGVGKTTTIAKLAANYALLGGCSVGIATIDTYRIGAVEQLGTYADIIGVDLKVASNAESLNDVILEFSDKDIVLVDTAGRSQHDQPHLEDLKELLGAVHLDEVHLVVSAGTRARDLNDIIDTFGRQLPVTHLIVTKLDETSHYGAIVNACMRLGKPLSFLTTGQTVPDDIEGADPKVVANLLLGE